MHLYKTFLDKFEKAVIASKREITEINLIAVSKKKPKEDILEVIKLNQKLFGENQIQEIEKKWPSLKKKYNDLKLHFIGGIQSKKANSIYLNCDVIHSIDRQKLVKIFNDLEEKNKIKKEYFIQINTGNEPQKSGVLFSEAKLFIKETIENSNLNIRGLMCLPPINEDPEKHFLKLRDLATSFNLSSLSMGMSNDFETAIKCGATHIRIGSEIFGSRD